MAAVLFWVLLIAGVAAFFWFAFKDRKETGGAPAPEKPVTPGKPDLEKPE